MTFVLTNIRSDDSLQRTRGEIFLSENPDPGVRVRPPEQLDRAIDTGQGLLVSRNNVVKAISLVYQYDPGSAWPVAYEIGTMRVTAVGHRLQVFLASFHLVQIYLEDDATRGTIFAVVSPGSPSEHNLNKHVGMQPFTPPDIISLLRAKNGLPFDPAKIVLGAGDNEIHKAFLTLSALHLGGHHFRTPNGNETIAIETEWFDPGMLKCGPTGGS